MTKEFCSVFFCLRSKFKLSSQFELSFFCFLYLLNGENFHTLALPRGYKRDERVCGFYCCSDLSWCCCCCCCCWCCPWRRKEKRKRNISEQIVKKWKNQSKISSFFRYVWKLECCRWMLRREIQIVSRKDSLIVNQTLDII